MRLHERVPDFFEPNRRLPISELPQQRNHLAESPDVSVLRQVCDHVFEDANERSLVRPFVDHEICKRARRIEADVSTLGAHTDQIDATIRELLFEAYSMVMGADVDARVARAQAVGKPASERIDEKAVVFVELNQMRMRLGVSPSDRRWKGRARQPGAHPPGVNAFYP